MAETFLCDRVRFKDFFKTNPSRFSKFTEAQRQAIISMRNAYFASKKGGDSNVVAAAMTAVQDDMSTLEDRIISAVSRASNENDDNASSVSEGSKRKANTGSIGSFLASKNKRSKK